MGELDRERQTDRTTESEMKESYRKTEKERQKDTDPYHNEFLGIQ